MIGGRSQGSLLTTVLKLFLFVLLGKEQNEKQIPSLASRGSASSKTDRNLSIHPSIHIIVYLCEAKHVFCLSNVVLVTPFEITLFQTSWSCSYFSIKLYSYFVLFFFNKCCTYLNAYLLWMLNMSSFFLNVHICTFISARALDEIQGFLDISFSVLQPSFRVNMLAQSDWACWQSF